MSTPLHSSLHMHTHTLPVRVCYFSLQCDSYRVMVTHQVGLRKGGERKLKTYMVGWLGSVTLWWAVQWCWCCRTHHFILQVLFFVKINCSCTPINHTLSQPSMSNYPVYRSAFHHTHRNGQLNLTDTPQHIQSQLYWTSLHKHIIFVY